MFVAASAEDPHKPLVKADLHRESRKWGQTIRGSPVSDKQKKEEDAEAAQIAENPVVKAWSGLDDMQKIWVAVIGLAGLIIWGLTPSS